MFMSCMKCTHLIFPYFAEMYISILYIILWQVGCYNAPAAQLTLNLSTSGCTL